MNLNPLSKSMALVAFFACFTQISNAKEPFTCPKAEEIIEEAIRAQKFPGAVLLVLNQGVVYRKAFGNKQLQPEKQPMTVATIFDCASLTKPVATTTCIFHLWEQGKLQLTDPVAKYWPEIAANGKEKLTIAHLLQHRSGLIADNSLADYAGGKEAALRKIAALPLRTPLGEKMVYSDVGFIVLGHLVERLSGKNLADYFQKTVAQPLKLENTHFLVPENLRVQCAPTAQRNQQWIRGEVHDPRAWAMGGIAGHAGLFSTADDMATFVQAIFTGKILKSTTWEAMLEPKSQVFGRAYGWDVSSAYSSQSGTAFEKKSGFGHTGFTGTSIWVDRPTKSAVILLTNRVHMPQSGSINTVRAEVATEIAKTIKQMSK
ncbi:MAG: serine hydrolase domain-containing protein [Zavarzinella sp.]